ncbi:hypothetical protein L0222_03520 [bacterium]|nr:hypothetical protein [bacterium]MCI0605960.1 hypothetical protein [bacterium]
MPTKAKASKSKKSKGTKSGKDVAAFVDHLHKDKKARAILKKGWDDVVKAGKKKGFKFTKQELHDHLKKRYNVKSLNEGDEPDTCVCI